MVLVDPPPVHHAPRIGIMNEATVEKNIQEQGYDRWQIPTSCEKPPADHQRDCSLAIPSFAHHAFDFAIHAISINIMSHRISCAFAHLFSAFQTSYILQVTLLRAISRRDDIVEFMKDTVLKERMEVAWKFEVCLKLDTLCQSLNSF